MGKECQPRFDDGEPLKLPPQRRYCDKGGHWLRSQFNKALEKAQKQGLPIEKVDLQVDTTVIICPKSEDQG